MGLLQGLRRNLHCPRFGRRRFSAFVFALVYSQLPPIDTVVDYKPKVPMRVWTADGKLIAEFGEERRDFVTINEIPPLVKEALISAEDDGFYQHAGIEPKGFIRAALNNLATGRKSQGASTITMQVARNFFLSSERSYIRKLYEVAMAFKIEANLSKDEILQIYMNQIFLGNRAYGFAAAARTYYGKSLQQLTAGEAAALQTGKFLRADLVYVSYYALEATMPDGAQTLGQVLISKGIFTEEAWAGAQSLVKSQRM